MKWNKKFIYPKSQREILKGRRHYSLKDQKLPSVTTILSATQTEEKKASLARWQAKVGKNEADRVMQQAASRGSNMHLFLEKFILGQGHDDLTEEGKTAKSMAQTVIDKGLGDLQEIWGSEVTLWYPDLYAGATDLVGVYDYEDSIIDFKQSNKPKRREWIDDYFMQLAAYAMAHNQIYDTQISQGVILMCTPDNYFQKFQIKGKEFKEYKYKFLERVDLYYKQVKLIK
jgi:hypothetical protein